MVAVAIPAAAEEKAEAAPAQSAGADSQAPAAGAAAPPAPLAPAAPSSSSTGAPVESLEQVYVTGIRANLEKSLEIKKDAAVILDSINSTELGRFPDADVADALAHLPGITISRTTGGEGMYVNVRGLGPQYNIVTLNNRILATDDDGRDLAFDVLPAELIEGADVLKSAQASALEGSIGGTVNLRTASAFEHPGFHSGVHLEGDYNTMSELHGGKLSAFAEDTFNQQTMGFVLGVVHSALDIRTDSLNAYNQNIYGPPTLPVGNTQVPVSVSPCCITFGSVFDDKRRDAISGKFEWKPNSEFKVTTDGYFSHLNDPQIGYNESYYFPWGTNQYGASEYVNPTIVNGLVTAVTATQFQPEMVNNTMDRIVNTSELGLNAEWKPLPRWTFTGDLYESKARRPEGGTDSFVTAGLVSPRSPYSIDTLNMSDVANSLPNLNVVVPPGQLGLKTCPPGTASATNAGQCSYTALMDSGFLDNNNFWSTHYDGLNGYTVHDMVSGATLDGAYDVNEGWLDRVLFGIGDTHRDKGRWDKSNDWTNGSGQYGSLYQTAGCPVQCKPYTFASQGFNVISMVNLPNFMQGAGGSYPTTLPQLNVPALLAFMQSLNGKPNPLYCTSYPCTGVTTPFDYALTLPQVNPYNSYDVSERTYSVYAEAELAGKNWAGNAGLRIVRTDTTASTIEAAPTSLWTGNPNLSTVTYNVQYGNSQQVASDGQYTLLLPSANLNYWLKPDELQLRVGLAETMSRPELSELAPTSSNNAINGEPQLYYNGTAGLRPIKALQADLSLEWYYHPHDVLAGAIFGKKIRDDIYTAVTSNVNLGTIAYTYGPPGKGIPSPFLWTITAPANGSKDLFDGIEISWQHILDNGLGTRMQYTHTVSKGWDQTGTFIGPINAVPPTTYSVGLIYDKDPFSAEVQWDWQSSYIYACTQCTEVPNWPAVSDSFAWVTASAHYKVTKELELYVEGKNLTDSVARTYLNGNPLLPWAPGQNVGGSLSGVGVGYSAYGRTYTAGAAYRF